MKTLTALLIAMVLPFVATAQDTVLPAPLQDLLAAAADDADPTRFESAVGLLALTQPVEAILSGASALSEDHEARARDALGIEPASAPPPTAAKGASTEAGSGWLAVPRRAVSTIANGSSDLWSGQIRAGFRQDSGNSDQLDYTFALTVERDLSVWGFQGSIDYGYSELAGAVGRDALNARTQLDREVGERWTIFTGARYEQDALSGFDWRAQIDAGFGYRFLLGDVRTWRVQLGPAIRFGEPVNGDMRTDAGGEVSSDFDWQISETLLFSADSQILLTDQSRFEQTVAMQTRLGEVWALQLAHRYSNEFDPEPGFDAVNTRTDVSVVREF